MTDTRQEVGVPVRDTIRTAPKNEARRTRPPTTAVRRSPGFTALVGLIAVLASALLIARRQTNE